MLRNIVHTTSIVEYCGQDCIYELQQQNLTMSNKNSAKKGGGDSIEEREETGGITEGIDKGMKGDNNAGECVLITVPSNDDKEEDSDTGDVMEKLGKLTS